MMPDDDAMSALLRHSPVDVVFGSGRLAELGRHAKAHGARRVLVVTDPGVEAAGHVARGLESLASEKLEAILFNGVVQNPTTNEVAAGREVARAARIDFIVAIGGGSSMDCAKGINLLLTNGGEIRDYWGVDRAVTKMLPMIAVPTTAGTGSEAQSFALICDAETRRKMACGVRALPAEGGLRPRVAILDPDLTASQPSEVAKAVGIDAVAHAVETAGCNARNDISRAFSRHAWELLAPAFAASIGNQSDSSVRANMLLGAHLAGVAIENAMLGAAHACANPLTANYGVVHGVAVGVMLPHVIRFNAQDHGNPYADLVGEAEALVSIVEEMLRLAGLPNRLSQIGVPRDDLPELAALAGEEWTCKFNPRPLNVPALLELYERAYE